MAHALGERPRGNFRRASIRTPRNNLHEWQVPKRTSRPLGRQEPFRLTTNNRFSQLPETERAGEVHPDIGGEPITPPHKKPRSKKQSKPTSKQKPPHVAETTHAAV